MSYLFNDFWVYDLSGNKMTKRDVKEAQKLNLTVRYSPTEFYIIGSYLDILTYLSDYIGVEMVKEYLHKLKDVI